MHEIGKCTNNQINIVKMFCYCAFFFALYKYIPMHYDNILFRKIDIVYIMMLVLYMCFQSIQHIVKLVQRNRLQ